MPIKFGLLGKGTISKRHINAIKQIGGRIIETYDPFLSNLQNEEHLFKYYDFDYAVICSPSHLHYDHIKLALKYDKKIIVEKPQQLPWQNLIDDENINIVMQYNWLENLPESANEVECIMVRDEEYFRSWKGEIQKTGGVFPLLFIHYIDLAIKLNATFKGKVIPVGKQVRRIDNFDLTNIDMDELYSRMYHDVCYNNKGIKPKDTMFLNWVLERAGWMYGHGYDILGKQIEFLPNDLINLTGK